MFLSKTKTERKKLNTPHSTENDGIDTGEYHVSLHIHTPTTLKEYVLFLIKRTHFKLGVFNEKVTHIKHF